MSERDEPCLNCGAVLVGDYCHRCGQRAEPRVLPVRTLLAGVADDVLSWDARLVRTLRALLLRPGFLTREYVAGRRVDYIPPFRLYLMVSAVNLALAAVLRANQFFFFSAKPGAENERIIALLPRVMFLVLPAFAVLLALVYRRRFFVEHVIFALHFHSAAFILATLHILLTTPAAIPAWLGPGVRVLDGVVQIGVLVYLYAALRRAYERSRLGTAASMLVVLAGYTAVFACTLFLLVQLMIRFRPTA